MRRITIGFFGFLISLVLSGVSLAARPHFVGSPDCFVENDQLCCSGKIAGLGTAPTTVNINAAVQCRNRGDNLPPGQASGSSGPINPRGGQITFTNVCTAVEDCPDDMTPTFGPGVTINVFQNGNLVFSATVPIN